MDKLVLTQWQMQYLKDFIRRKGFREEVIVNEILDHFACKVEELMTGEAQLLFEDAVVKAHRSFGVRGFRPIAEAFENGLRERYKRLFRKEIANILISVKWIPLIVTVTVFIYKLYMWAQVYDIRWLNQNVAADAILCFTITGWLFFVKRAGGWRMYRRNYFMYFVQYPVFVCYLIFFGPDRTGWYPHVWLSGCLYAAIGAYTFVYTIASFKVQRIALREYAEIKKYTL